MFIGRSGCGKSTIIKQWAANIIRPFKHGVIVEASIEGGIVSRRNEILTGFSPMELKKKLRSRNEGVSIESCYDEIKAIRDLNDSFKSFCRENRCTGGCPIKTYKENNKLEDANCASVYLVFKLKEKGIF